MNTLLETYQRSSIIAYNFKDFSIDFTLTYSVFGEVLKVESDILALPNEAQAMMLGKGYKDKLKAIEYYFKYSLPLVATNYLEIPLFSEIKSNIGEMAGSKPKNWLPEASIQDKWTRKIYAFHDTSDKSNTLDYLTRILKFILDSSSYTWFSIEKELDDLVGQAIINLFPIIADNQDLWWIYSALYKYKNKETYQLLRTHLMDFDKRSYHDDVINILTTYENRAELTGALFIEYYHQFKDGLDIWEVRILVDALVEFKYTKAIPFFNELLPSEESGIAIMAYQGLNAMGESMLSINKTIKAAFVNPEDPQKIFATVGLMNQIEMEEFFHPKKK